MGKAPNSEQLFIKHVTDKELVSRIYKEYLQIRKRKKNPVRKWAKI